MGRVGRGEYWGGEEMPTREQLGNIKELLKLLCHYEKIMY